MSKFIMTLVIVFATALGATLAVQASAEEPSFDPAGTVPITQCPAPTNIGVYFVRGHTPDGGVICGLAYYDACPYLEGEAAGSLMCTKVSSNPPSAPAITTPVLEAPAVTVISEPKQSAECGGR